MASRYEDRLIAINKDERYKNIFRERRINFVRQYKSPSMQHIQPEDNISFNEIPVIWSREEAFWKISARLYGDPELWWVIAWYNLLPTDHHVAIGTEVLVPFPLSSVLNILRDVG